MKKLSLTVAGLLLAMTGSAFAAALVQGVSESTDPAAVAAVEQHAAALQSQATTMPMQHTRHHHSKMHHAHHMHHMQHSSAQPTEKDTAK